MSKVLFPLALANLRKNYRLYGPFALAFVTSVALLYNFITLAFNPSLSSLRGGPSIVTVLALGMIILAITGPPLSGMLTASSSSKEPRNTGSTAS